MKKIFALTLCFFVSFTLNAQTLSKEKLDFNLINVPLHQLVTVVYGEILKEPFFVDETIKNDPVSVNFRGATPEAMKGVLDTYLESKKIKRIQFEGVNMFRPISDSNAVKSIEIQGEPSFLSSAFEHVKVKAIGDKIYDAAVALPSGSTIGMDETSKSNSVFLYKSKFRSATDLIKVVQVIAAKSVPVGDDILLMGSSNQLSVARLLLDQVDQPVNEVIVKSTVAEYTSSEDDGLGVMGALRLFGDRLSLSVGSNNVGSNLLSFKNASLEAVLSVISNDSRFNVVDTSTLRVVSGKSGNLIVGQEVPILGSLVQTQNGQVMQNITYRNAGLQVEIKPTIIRDRVHVDVKQIVSSFVVTKSSNIDSPTMLKREFSSTLSTDLGEVVVLGGLDEQRESDARSGLFGFRTSTVKSKSRTSLFLILQFQRT